MPHLVQVAGEFADEGLQVLAVSYDLMVPGVSAEDALAKAAGYQEEAGLPFPVLVFDGPDYEAVNRALSLPGQIPVTLAFDAAGEEVARAEKPVDEEGMRALARAALGAAEASGDAAGEEPAGGATADPPPGEAPTGMRWIPPGTFLMGSDAPGARPDEAPLHRVRVSGFWMDEHELTNDEFARFVADTGYLTTAERPLDWEELRRQLPEGTPKPDDSVLQPGSLVFHPTGRPVSLRDPGQWWSWTLGASWRHPEGPGSDLQGRGDHPVVHVSWHDAQAYAAWAGKRLPTEAEWAWAARGGDPDARYAWGDAPPDARQPAANLWQGEFPVEDRGTDGFAGTAPVGSFPPNGFGLYDMSGNVWEWCSDLYHARAYAMRAGAGVVVDPQGPDRSHDPAEPRARKRVTRGGSFLCHGSYCAGYRVSARMKTTEDSGLSHTGFRLVRDP